MDEIEAGMPEGELTPEEMQAMEEEREREERDRLTRLDSLAMRLESDLREHLGLRQSIEERWLQDHRQYNGSYEEKTIANIRAKKGSAVFINITRPKCATGEARLVDLLFPTDDKNWGIRPTPSPLMATALSDERETIGEDGQPTTVKDAARSIQEEAETRCAAMEREIEDNLRESNYNIEARLAIHDAVVLGSGVLCGPIVTGRTRQAWQPDPETGEYTMQTVDDIRPEVRRVNPWNFVPDMSAATMGDARFAFERRYLHQRGMMQLLDDPYYLRPQLIEAIKKGPRDSHIGSRHPTNEQREQADQRGDSAQQAQQDAFEVWSYHGPLKASELRAAGVEDAIAGEYIEELGDDAEVMGCVVFCNGIVIKAYINPLDSGDLPFSVFTYEKDESCVFGFGVPYRMRHQQATLNAAWRALMDNTGLTVLPQTVVNSGLLEPADGDWSLSGGKTWYLTDRNRNVNEVFAFFNIPSHQAELQQVIELSRRFIDDETNLPLITQGDQGTHITQTASGMSMLMNAANVVTRHIVKNWDDQVTEPLLTRFYDWNMQYNDNEDIKGDYEVDARGATVMMTRELESQALMVMATQFAQNPLYAPMLKPEKLLNRIVKTLNLSPDEVLKSEEELAADQQQMAEQGGQPDPAIAVEQMKMQAQQELLQLKSQHEQQMEQMRAQARMQEAMLERETQMIRLASQEKLTLEQLRAKLADTRIKEESKQVTQAREIAIKTQMGSGL